MLQTLTFRNSNEFRVRVGDEIHCHMGSKNQTIMIQQDPAATGPEFRKTKTGFVFSCQ